MTDPITCPECEGQGGRRRNLGWVQQHEPVVGAEALGWYRSWDMSRLAAYGFPYAQGPELDLDDLQNTRRRRGQHRHDRAERVGGDDRPD
ncbi:hypothetical protein ABZ260_51120 [Streptosporangium sp. NPDC006013]|uniref:hypothetical protein n=1 Tax=Streptosporangium sp. NPDC006013 TaxID=3155596 RepID=UPI0033A88DBF